MSSTPVVSAGGAPLGGTPAISSVEARIETPASGPGFEEHMRGSLGGESRSSARDSTNTAAVAEGEAAAPKAVAATGEAQPVDPADAELAGDRFLPVEVAWTRLPVLRHEEPTAELEMPPVEGAVEEPKTAEEPATTVTVPPVVPLLAQQPVIPAEVAGTLEAVDSPAADGSAAGELTNASALAVESESRRESTRTTPRTAGQPTGAATTASTETATADGASAAQSEPESSPAAPRAGQAGRAAIAGPVPDGEAAVAPARGTVEGGALPVDQRLAIRPVHTNHESRTGPEEALPPQRAAELGRAGQGEPLVEPRVEGRRLIAREELGSRLNAFVAERAEVAMLRRGSPLPFDGTGAAKDHGSMRKAPIENQIAGSTMQKLPGTGGGLPTGEFRSFSDLTDEGPSARARFARPGGEAVSMAMGVGLQRTQPVEHMEAPAAIGGTARPAEQLLLNLTREVAQFKRYNAESMAVVLRPDANTEIFLHLATRNGQVDVQARFERGDFSSLNGQWSQLQQTMAQQGVRLSSLQDGHQPPADHQNAGQSAWGQGQSQQQRRGGQDSADARPASFEDFFGGGAVTEPLRKQARTHQAKSGRSILEAWA